MKSVLTMGKPSWVCTVITQLSLCLAALIAFNLGRPWEKSISNCSRFLDIYFISVRGGFRPLNQQTRLLKQVFLSFIEDKYRRFFVLYGFRFNILMVGIFGFGSVGGFGILISRSVWLLRIF